MQPRKRRQRTTTARSLEESNERHDEEDAQVQRRTNCDFSADHPRWGRIEREIESMRSGKEECAWLKYVRARVSDRYRSKLGRGWLLEARIEAPSQSPHSGANYDVHLYVPEAYPRRPPVPTFVSIVSHFQVDALGRPAEIFFSEDNLDWTPAARKERRPSRIVDVLRLLHEMLKTPLVEPEPSDDDLLRMWRLHAPMVRHFVRQILSTNENHGAFASSARLDGLLELLPLDHTGLLALPKPRRDACVESLRDLYVRAIRPHQHYVLERHASQRLRTIRSYAPPRPSVFVVDPELVRSRWLAPTLVRALDAYRKRRESPYEDDATVDAWWRRTVRESVVRKLHRGVYAFDMLRPSIVSDLVAVVRHFEASDLPKSRPNSMNRLGIILNDMGLERTFDVLLDIALRPVAAALFPDEGGDSIDHHHSFVVRYRSDDDDDDDEQRHDGTVGLAMHRDDSEITFNISLLADVTGGGGAVRFCGLASTASHRRFTGDVGHRPGRAFVHLGAHRHGAVDIEGGERINLIVWCRSREVRDSLAERPRIADDAERTKNAEPPDVRCLSHAHDGDYEKWAPGSIAVRKAQKYKGAGQ